MNEEDDERTTESPLLPCRRRHSRRHNSLVRVTTKGLTVLLALALASLSPKPRLAWPLESLAASHPRQATPQPNHRLHHHHHHDDDRGSSQHLRHSRQQHHYGRQHNHIAMAMSAPMTAQNLRPSREDAKGRDHGRRHARLPLLQRGLLPLRHKTAAAAPPLGSRRRLRGVYSQKHQRVEEDQAGTDEHFHSDRQPPFEDFQNVIRALRVAAKGKAPPLAVDNINPKVVTAEYAVRGELVTRANKFKEQLAQGNSSLPFDEVIECNTGNPHAIGQKPITFFRQVLSLVTYPALLESEGVEKSFRKDAIAKAREMLKVIPNGSGAYSHSMGYPGIRKMVARFIERRDGHPSDPNNIFLTDGASAAVKLILQLLIRDTSDGVMVPIPQYPLYSASIALFGGAQVGYGLDEKRGWGTSVGDLKEAYERARADGVNVRALVLINPGNPTGQCLDEEGMRDIVRFCHETGTVLLADEVYQVNVYGSTPFTSFKKVVADMEDECPGVSLVSFHSVSKGFLGECGRRGGYMEIHNFPKEVQDQIYKLSSVTLCSNVDGQIMVGLMVGPPEEGSDSYAEYTEESKGILKSLEKRSNMLLDVLNGLEGVSCNPVDGALYAFPRITIPAKAIEVANKMGKAPDFYYCSRLLNETGILVIPGSGFGQKPGTFHFRTTILPPPEKINKTARLLEKFHERFLLEHA